MSGHKCSEFRLQREKEEKLRLLQTIGELHGQVNALKEHIHNMLNNASDGLRSTFSVDVGKAEYWLGSLEIPEIKGLDIQSDFGFLKNTRTQLGRIAHSGGHIQESLTISFTQKADELGQRLAKQLAELEGMYLKYQQVLSLWFPEEQRVEWEQELKDAKLFMGNEQYAVLEKKLAEIKADITSKAKFAEKQEDKHQKRLYLLKALRQVCFDMGFEEASAPKYEREGDRSSRILFTVDTWDRGKIAFNLSLDGISSFSEIAENHCFEEFEQISQYLDEEFGIHTEFRLADGEPAPRLIRKGERDIPNDESMKAEA